MAKKTTTSKKSVLSKEKQEITTPSKEDIKEQIQDLKQTLQPTLIHFQYQLEEEILKNEKKAGSKRTRKLIAQMNQQTKQLRKLLLDFDEALYQKKD